MKNLIVKELEKSSKEYEVYLQKTEINEIHLQKNKINFFNKTINGGYGTRLHTKGVGFSSSNIFSDSMIKQTIKNALLAILYEIPTVHNYRSVERQFLLIRHPAIIQFFPLLKNITRNQRKYF